MKLSLLVCTSIVAALFPPQDASKATGKLMKAIREVNEEEARAAILELTTAGPDRAINVLLDAHELCAKKNTELTKRDTALLNERRKVQPEPHKLAKGPLQEQMDRIQADTHKLSATMNALRNIREELRKGFARLPQEETLTALTRALSKRGDPETRAEYALALGGLGTPEAGKALVKTLENEKEALVRVTILDTLRIRKMGSEDVVAAVAPLLKDKYWQVVVAAARLLESIGSPNAVEQLIEELKTADNRLKEEINDALIGLTRVNKHGSYPAWKDWWDRNGKQFIAGQYSAPKGELGSKRDQAGGSTFYGIEINSDKLVFVIDASNSMSKEAKMETADQRRRLGGGRRHSGSARTDRFPENLRREIRTEEGAPRTAGRHSLQHRLFQLHGVVPQLRRHGGTQPRDASAGVQVHRRRRPSRGHRYLPRHEKGVRVRGRPGLRHDGGSMERGYDLPPLRRTSRSSPGRKGNRRHLPMETDF